ncbi:UDP:flavonoid glycosyltransferase YjiC, YdhE family [Desulfotomaculum arcticum]|uniref:UDP:flavonoid glycosyltransferase YjiC, YdhE family n=2 Tax=Desulfotruncus TaxID=2867377 RepID=A0A1I2RB43_9FIRM|nr:UDP:flavonoid glycosyltransferase YjiC, YdhE family [Desulfotomaculum arcticum] [Desulfotruncus arcticus DSM 17038]
MRVIAVAKALQRKGHEVKVLAGDKQVSVIKDHHLDVIELPPIPKIDFPIGILAGTDSERQEDMMARMKEVFQPVAEAEKESVSVEKPDVMLCGNFTGPLAAKTFHIPCAMVLLQPHGKKTTDFMTRRLSKGHAFDFLNAANLLIMEGMPELSGDSDPELSGAGFAAIKDKIRFTGPLLAEPPENLPGQEELKARHTGNNELPLAYVTIGGGTPLIGEDFLALVLKAFRQLAGVNGVISTGLAIDPDRLAGCDPPDNVFIRGFVPGTELIKAGDVTVFHGGSSTLMTCIACGKPAVVVPSMAEQEDNGDVLAQNRAGIVLDKKGLTSTALAEAVKKILHEHSFRDNAQRLKKLGEKYGGAPAAAAMVEELAGKGGTL